MFDRLLIAEGRVLVKHEGFDMMNNATHCAQCGADMPADSPQGVCPKCLFGLGLSSRAEAKSADGTLDASVRFVPPKPHELAAHFPQLEILDLIGVGGMGAVYKAVQRGLDRGVALKILPPEVSQDPAFAERFGREARALARLSHPHIVSVFESGEVGGLYFFVMEYVDGINLHEAIQTGELGSQEALAIVPQLCDALQYAHDEGIVHRDIKPENVLLDKKGGVKFADFGLARILDKSSDNFTLTDTHQVMGTPRYMAPEQMERSHEVDHRADIYSLGVVFYEMLTGELPLGRFAPPSRKVQLDVRLDEVVLRTLEKEPGLRYQHVSELKTDVETIRGLGNLPPHMRRFYGHEYRSQTHIMGWPLVHVATGVDPRTGRKRVAKGIIAVGDIAIGALAMGGVAMGGVTFGGCSLGLLAFGGISLGVLLAIGGGALGLGLSMGGLAVGSIAVGGLAVGVASFGGGAFGVLAYGGNAQDPETLRIMSDRMGLLRIAVLVVMASLLLTIVPSVIVAASRRKRGNEEHSKRNVQGLPAGVKTAIFAALGLLLLLPCLLAFLTVPLYLSLSRAPHEQVADALSSEFLDTDDQLAFRVVPETGEPRISAWFARSLGISTELQQEIHQVLGKVQAQYLELEQQHSRWSINETGHQVTTIGDLSSDVQRLEHELWSQLDRMLDVTQQRAARENLRVYTHSNQLQLLNQQLKPGLLGWGPTGAKITIWHVGSWYQWDVHQAAHHVNGQAPVLPAHLQRYWRED